MQPFWRVVLFASLVGTLVGCSSHTPTGGVDAGADAGTTDLCNSPEEAATLAACALPADGGELARFIETAGDADWYRFDVPPSALAAPLVRIRGRYPGSSHPVELDLLGADASTTLATGQIPSDGGIAELLVRSPAAGARLLLRIRDASGAGADVSHTYFVGGELVADPDPNEPNDANPTPIALDAGSGSNSGILATGGDVDRFSVEVPRFSGERSVLYVRLTAPVLVPPSEVQLGFDILALDGGTLLERKATDAASGAELAGAVIAEPGIHSLLVKDMRTALPASAAGDPRLSYRLEVMALPEADVHEPNEDPATAPVASLLALGRTTFEGRLDWAGDVDWHVVELNANSQPTRLTYRYELAVDAGRFPDPSGAPDLELIVAKATSGAAACEGDPGTCPAGPELDAQRSDLRLALCTGSVPLCLISDRWPDAPIPALHNFQGSISVPPHASTTRYFIGIKNGAQADDRPYRLEVEWLADPDEASRYSGGTEARTTLQMAVDSSGTFPSPPPGATVLAGTLATGHGGHGHVDAGSGLSIRGARDYDAQPSDVDPYEVDLPSLPAPLDRTWELQWSLDRADGGYVHDLALDVLFCDGDRLDAGTCTPVGLAGSAAPFTLAYVPEAQEPWQQPPSGPLLLWERTTSSTADTTTAAAAGCLCLEPRFVRGGMLLINVSAVDRASYAEVPYRVRMALASYPRSYAVPGGTASCPAPVDAGGGVWLPGCRYAQ